MHPGRILERRARCEGEVERVHRPDPAEFRRRFRRAGRPAVVTGVVDRWPAFERWSFDFFRSSYGAVDVRVSSLFAQPRRMPLAGYLDLLAAGEVPRGAEGLALYLEGWHFLRAHPELAQDFQAPACMGPDWMARLFPRGYGSWASELLIGPAGAFTKLHVDSHRLPGWLAQLAGRKRWVVAAPAGLDELLPDRRARAGGYPGVEHPAMADHPAVERARYQVAEVGPGDLIYVPGGWYHQVTLLEDSLSLSHNFCGGRELPRVLYELARSSIGARLRLGGS